MAKRINTAKDFCEEAKCNGYTHCKEPDPHMCMGVAIINQLLSMGYDIIKFPKPFIDEDITGN